MEGGFVYRNDDSPIPRIYLSGPVRPVVLGGVMERGVLFIATTTARSPEHILVVLSGPWC